MQGCCESNKFALPPLPHKWYNYNMLTYKYRIKDSTSQNHLGRIAGAVNFVWNYCNEVSMLALRRNKKWLSAYDLHQLIAGTSKTLGLSADSIQQACTEYVTRRRQFKKHRLAWRSRQRSLGWIPFKARYIKLTGDTVTYCGHTFRLWLSRPIKGTVKAGSFTQDARGRWYVSLQCEIETEDMPYNGDEIGVDLGLKDTAVCSDGIKYSRENLTKQYADQLAMAQRAGKKKRVKAIHAKIKHIRKDWAHKVTTDIASRARQIVVGDVSSSKLAKTRMAKSVYDASWHQFRSFLKYKAIKLGAMYADVNESFSSVTCSDCHKRTGPSGLSALGVREWYCTNCGVLHNRDTNAALNILRLGRQTPIKGIPVL